MPDTHAAAIFAVLVALSALPTDALTIAADPAADIVAYGRPLDNAVDVVFATQINYVFRDATKVTVTGSSTTQAGGRLGSAVAVNGSYLAAVDLRTPEVRLFSLFGGKYGVQCTARFPGSASKVVMGNEVAVSAAGAIAVADLRGKAVTVFDSKCAVKRTLSLGADGAVTGLHFLGDVLVVTTAHTLKYCSSPTLANGPACQSLSLAGVSSALSTTGALTQSSSARWSVTSVLADSTNPAGNGVVVGLGFASVVGSATVPIALRCARTPSLKCSVLKSETIKDGNSLATAVAQTTLGLVVSKRGLTTTTTEGPSGLSTSLGGTVRADLEETDPRMDPPQLAGSGTLVFLRRFEGDTAPTLAGVPSPCRLSSWSAWSAKCTATCGPGQKIRSRTKLADRRYGGALCEANLEESKSCTYSTRTWGYQDWTKCTARAGKCETGTRKRPVYCKACSNSVKLPISECENGKTTPPASRPKDHVEGCDSYTYTWKSALDKNSKCVQTKCGQGTRTYKIWCRRCDGRTVTNSKCGIKDSHGNPQPLKSRPCVRGTDDRALYAPYKRHYGSWSLSDSKCRSVSKCGVSRTRSTSCTDCRGRKVSSSWCPAISQALGQQCPCAVGNGAGCLGSSSRCYDRNGCYSGRCQSYQTCVNLAGSYSSNPVRCVGEKPKPKKKKCKWYKFWC